MSIAILKKKSKRGTISGKGKNGFSIVGGYRNKGRVGQTHENQSIRTLFKGTNPLGYGGNNNDYIISVIKPKINTNDEKIIKKPNLTTGGYILSRYENPTPVTSTAICNNGTCPPKWVKSFDNYSKTQGELIKKKRIVSSSINSVKSKFTNQIKYNLNNSCNTSNVSNVYCNSGYNLSGPYIPGILYDVQVYNLLDGTIVVGAIDPRKDASGNYIIGNTGGSTFYKMATYNIPPGESQTLAGYLIYNTSVVIPTFTDYTNFANFVTSGKDITDPSNIIVGSTNEIATTTGGPAYIANCNPTNIKNSCNLKSSIINGRRICIGNYHKDLRGAVSHSEYLDYLLSNNCLPTPPCKQSFPMVLNQPGGCLTYIYTPEEAIAAGYLPKNWMNCGNTSQAFKSNPYC